MKESFLLEEMEGQVSCVEMGEEGGRGRGGAVAGHNEKRSVVQSSADEGALSARWRGRSVILKRGGQLWLEWGLSWVRDWAGAGVLVPTPADETELPVRGDGGAGQLYGRGSGRVESGAAASHSAKRVWYRRLLMRKSCLYEQDGGAGQLCGDRGGQGRRGGCGRP